MRPLTPSRLLTYWALALVIWAVVATLCLAIGSTGLGWSAATFDLRRDRVLVASLVGLGLGAGGVGYQSVLRNPLADPYLLGASSGAALAAYLWTLPIVPTFLAIQLGQPVFAFAGAMIAVGVVLLLAGGRGRLDPTRAILVGVVVSVLCGGLFVLFVKIFRETPSGGTALDFLFGRVRSLLAEQYLPLAGMMLLGVAGLAISGRTLADVAGDETRAATVGSLHRTRWIVLIVASLLVALTAAMAGPIGFVGLIAPHVARLLVGPDPRRVLPVAAFGGAILVALTDAVGRSAVQWNAVGSELPVGVLTNLLGAPFFLVLLYARRGRISELGSSA